MPSPFALRTVVALLAAAFSASATAQVPEKRYAPEAIASALAAGLAVPVNRSAADEGTRDGRDDVAIRRFCAAATEGVDAPILLLTIAMTTADVQVARRALTAAGFSIGASNRERAVPLLLALAEHADPLLASMAADALDDHVGQALSQSLRQLVVARAMARWPADELELRWQWRSSFSLCCPGPTAPAPSGCAPPWPSPRRRWVEGYYETSVTDPARTAHAGATHVPSRLVRAAAATGSRAVIDRLMARAAPAARPDPSDPRIGFHECFLRWCLKLAAPNVDPETARRMHGWFLPEVAKWKAPGTPNSTLQVHDGWTQAAFDVIANLFGNVPDDLLRAYAPLLRDDATKLELRRCLRRVDAIPAARVRLLLLPLGREKDRNLMLRAPSLVAAALRSDGSERRHMIDLLEQRSSCDSTAAHWQAVLPAIVDLPPKERHSLLNRLSSEFRRLGVDVEPFAQTALRGPDDQRG